MSKNRHLPPSQRAATSAPRDRATGPAGPLPFAIRGFLSLVIVWHLAAVFMAPMSVSVSMSQPSSLSEFAEADMPLVLAIAQQRPMQWYLDALYLNHGYHFFAPDPGTGHLIRYAINDQNGSEIRAGEFPNAEEQWPRLLYHRYFMLAGQCEVPSPDEAEMRQWKQRYLSAYADELMRRYGGESVRLQRFIHHPLLRDDALKGRALTFPDTYQLDDEVVRRRLDLALPAPNPLGATQRGDWQQVRQDVASGWHGGQR